MFEHQERNVPHRPWPWIICVVVVVLAAVQILRVNAPQTVKPDDNAFHATNGTVLDGEYTVAARNFLAVRMDFNHQVKLTGRFRTPRVDQLINCLVLDAENFELWKNGSDCKKSAQTGAIPGGKINLVLEAGTYFIVLDNRSSDTEQPVEAHFSAD